MKGHVSIKASRFGFALSVVTLGSIILLLGCFLVLSGSKSLSLSSATLTRNLKSVEAILAEVPLFNMIHKLDGVLPVKTTKNSGEPDPRLHMVGVVIGPTQAARLSFMTRLVNLVRRVLVSSTRNVTLHVITNAYDKIREPSDRREMFLKDLGYDPGIEYEIYCYCEMFLNVTTGKTTCPGEPTTSLPGAEAFTRVYSSFARRWPSSDNVHPDTEAYVLKIFSYLWMKSTAAGREASTAILVDNDVDFTGNIEDLLSLAPGGVLRAMQSQGAVIAMAPEMQPVYPVFWKSVVTPTPSRGFNGGVMVFDLHAARLNLTFNDFITSFDWELPSIQKYKSQSFIPEHLGDQTMLTILNETTPGGTSLIYELDCAWNRQMSTALKGLIAAKDMTPLWERAYFCPHDVRIVHYCGNSFSGTDAKTIHKILEIPAILALKFRAVVDDILGDLLAPAWAKDAARTRAAAPEPLI